MKVTHLGYVIGEASELSGLWFHLLPARLPVLFDKKKKQTQPLSPVYPRLRSLLAQSAFSTFKSRDALVYIASYTLRERVKSVFLFYI